jgi:hypothetical protein
MWRRPESCPISFTFQDSSSFESSNASDGQFDSSGLLTKPRRNSLSCSLLCKGILLFLQSHIPISMILQSDCLILRSTWRRKQNGWKA